VPSRSLANCSNRDNAIQLAVLVIFLRPVVVREPGLVAATSHLRERLPDEGFFNNKPRPGIRNFPAPRADIETSPP